MTGIIKLESGGLQHFGLTERQLHEHIHANPEVLGIPDVEVCGSEVIQSGGGRLDLLLQSKSYYERYAVEIQRGEPDESHIVRMLEYWDLEQRRSKDYDHYAVIVAENIVQGRFFNVLSLLGNKGIPIIAIDVTAVRQPDGMYGFVFSRVLDVVAEADESDISNTSQELVTEESWRSTRGDQMVDLVKKLCDKFGAKPYFTQYYAGIDAPDNGGRTAKFYMKVQKRGILLQIRMKESQHWNEQIQQSGLPLDYRVGKKYRFIIKDDTDVENHADLWLAMYRTAAGVDDDEEQAGVDDASN